MTVSVLPLLLLCLHWRLVPVNRRGVRCSQCRSKKSPLHDSEASCQAPDAHTAVPHVSGDRAFKAGCHEAEEGRPVHVVCFWSINGRVMVCCWSANGLGSRVIIVY